MKPSIQTSELVSALADGQLDAEELGQALHSAALDPSMLSSWNSYHLIGDVLRSSAAMALPVTASADLAFLERFNKHLVQEEPLYLQVTAVAKVSALKALASVPTTNELLHHRGRAANDGNFRWKLVAGLASLAAVSVIAWNVPGVADPALAPQLAQASVPQVVVASPQGPMVRDPRLEELLAAHQQLGGTSALQEPSGFLRNAIFEKSQDARR